MDLQTWLEKKPTNIKGGLRKIGDLPNSCRHPEHDPPSHYFYQDGVYEYTCPGCGRIHKIIVRNPSM
jgi:hypothetical protein